MLRELEKSVVEAAKAWRKADLVAREHGQKPMTKVENVRLLVFAERELKAAVDWLLADLGARG